jgi:hypothetical protein
MRLCWAIRTVVAVVLVARTAAACVKRPWLPPHCYLERTEAQSFMTRWKPQVVSGHLVSVSGLKSYARARIALENATGVLVQGFDMPNVFVVDHCEGVTAVTACLWHPNDARSRLVRLRALTSWHDETFPDAILVADEDDLCRDL